MVISYSGGGSSSSDDDDDDGYETTSADYFTGGYVESQDYETTSADHFTGGYVESPSAPDLDTSNEVDTSVWSRDRPNRLSDPDINREPVTTMDALDQVTAFDDRDITNFDGSGPADVVDSFANTVSSVETSDFQQAAPDPFGDRFDPSHFISSGSQHDSLEEASQDWERRAENLPGVGDQQFWGEGGKLEEHNPTNERLREEVLEHNERGEYLQGLSKGSAYVVNAFVDNPTFSVQRDVGDPWMRRSVAATDPTVDDPELVGDQMIAERGQRGSERLGELWAGGVEAATGADIENPESLGERAGAFATDVGAEWGGNLTHGYMGHNVQTGESGAIEDGWTALDVALGPVEGGALARWGLRGANRAGRRLFGDRRVATEAAEDSADMVYSSIGRVGINAVRRGGDEFVDNRQVQEGFDWLFGGASRTADDVPTRQTAPTTNIGSQFDEAHQLPKSVNELPAVDSEIRNSTLAPVRHLDDTPANRMDADDLPGSVEDFRRAVGGDERLIGQTGTEQSARSIVDDLSARTLDDVDEVGTATIRDDIDSAVRQIEEAVDAETARSVTPGARSIDEAVDEVIDIPARVSSGPRIADEGVEATQRTVRSMADDVAERTRSAVDNAGARTVRDSAEETHRAMTSTMRSMLDDVSPRAAREGAQEGAERARVPTWAKTLMGAAGGAAGVLALGGGAYWAITGEPPGGIMDGDDMPDEGEAPNGWSWAKVKTYEEGGMLAEVYDAEGRPKGMTIILAVDPEGQGRVYILEGVENPQMEQSRARAEGLGLAQARAPDNANPGGGAAGGSGDYSVHSDPQRPNRLSSAGGTTTDTRGDWA